MLVLSAYADAVATVGENFKRIRKHKGITQEQIYKALGFRRVSNVSLLENSKRLPKVGTIRKMAAVLQCETWELLEHVKTPHDELRQLNVPESDAPNRAHAETKGKRGGGALAVAGEPDHPASLPSATSEVDRPSFAVIEQLIREQEAGEPRAPRKPPAATRRQTAGRGAGIRKHRR